MEQPLSQSGETPRIAVTGAGGLVGGYLVRYLAGKGYPVVALVRATSGPSKQLVDFVQANKGIDVTFKTGDVGDVVSLKDLFSGVDVVVHAAGNVNPYGSREEIFKTNVDGSKNAMQAARDAGCKQFIHISSLSVITGQGDQYDVDESAPLRYCGENYADSKVATEEMLDNETVSGGISLTVMRPGFIYGPNEKTWMPRLIESIRTGKAALIDGGSKETNVINVENLCRAIEGAILNPVAYEQKYNLTDGEKISKKLLFDTISDALALPKVEKVIPSLVAKPFCNLISTIAPLLPVSTQQKLARYSRAAFRLVGVNQGFSITKAESQLHYVNRVPFVEGMRTALATFSSAGGAAGVSTAASYAGTAQNKS